MIYGYVTYHSHKAKFYTYDKMTKHEEYYKFGRVKREEHTVSVIDDEWIEILNSVLDNYRIEFPFTYGIGEVFEYIIDTYVKPKYNVNITASGYIHKGEAYSDEYYHRSKVKLFSPQAVKWVSALFKFKEVEVKPSTLKSYMIGNAIYPVISNFNYENFKSTNYIEEDIHVPSGSIFKFTDKFIRAKINIGEPMYFTYNCTSNRISMISMAHNDIWGDYGIVLNELTYSYRRREWLLRGTNGRSLVIPEHAIDIPSIVFNAVQPRIVDALNTEYEYCAPCNSSISDYLYVSLEGQNIRYYDKARAERASKEQKDYNKFAYKISVFKYLTNILCEKDNVIQKIGQDLSVDFTDTSVLKVISGKEITLAYGNGADKGTIGNSCMRYSSCSEYFKLYEDNAEMLIMQDSDGVVTARAMLWRVINSKTKEETKFVDRVYTANERDVARFKAYAKERGYIHLKDQISRAVRGIRYIDDRKQEIDLLDWYVPLKSMWYDKYPYIDTFAKLFDNKAMCPQSKVSDIIVCRSISGGFEKL